MPYPGEFAHYKPLHRIVENERVRKLLGEYEVRDASDRVDALQALNPIHIELNNWTPNHLIAIDGSHSEVDIKNGFPGAEASYITVAAVIIDVAKLKELDQKRPISPKAFRSTERAQSIDCALPGCNVVKKGEIAAKASLRRAIFEVFQAIKLFSDGESLLDTYEALLKYKPMTERSQDCPYEDCPDEREYIRGEKQYFCSCDLSRMLYSTDALRIHERMNPAGSNGAIFGEIMQTWEAIVIIHILRYLEQKQYLSSLRRLAIILDGPLAIFGQPAWISQAIIKELSRINELAKKVNKQDILLMGVEKSGMFVEHFENLDKKEEGGFGNIPKQSVGLLTDSYIKENIVFSSNSKSSKIYGEATYFGRKFFYKTSSGARLVGSLPFLSDYHRDMNTANTEQYPRLQDAVSLLNQLVSSRFSNAITPLVSANSEAAIPLNIGKKVLEKLAKEIMQGK
ncbi:DNA double-strand break repair nuclease NurA [bacterium]|nr:DNA double-strand break repair nuclease NurA [bacterium]